MRTNVERWNAELETTFLNLIKNSQELVDKTYYSKDEGSISRALRKLNELLKSLGNLLDRNTELILTKIVEDYLEANTKYLSKIERMLRLSDVERVDPRI